MTLRHALSAPIALALALVLAVGAAEAREEIRAVGSSTVFPFATAAADIYGRTTGHKTPVIESTGSGGGFKLFCAGVGVEHPDIVNASRAVKASEARACAQNGVDSFIEVKIGFDGIVVGNARTGPTFALSLRHVFLALAKEVPEAVGALVANPYRRWSDIDPALPDLRIRVLGPPPTSGTRDAFVELAMEGGCETFPWIKALSATDKDRYKRICHSLREDGAFVEAGENDNLIVQKLGADPNALGIFGFSFLEENRDILKGNPIGGRAPTFDNIASGAYPVSRSLFFYVKTAHVGLISGIEGYVEAFTAEPMWGPGGHLAAKGLIPLPAAARAAQRAEVLAALAAARPAAAGTAGTAEAPSRAPPTASPATPTRPLFALLLALIGLTVFAFYTGRRRAFGLSGGRARVLHSRPSYHGHFVALWCGLPALGVGLLWVMLEPWVVETLVVRGLPPALQALTPERLGLLLNDIRNVARGDVGTRAVDPAVLAAAEHYANLRTIAFAGLAVAVLAAGLAGLAWARRRIAATLRARDRVEATVRWMLVAGSTIAVFTTIGIILSLLFEAARFFDLVSLDEFLFGLQWSPQTALRDDQVGSAGAFGAIPVFVGTLVITVIAMLIAGPVGLMSAIFMSEYAAPRLRAALKPLLEILAGIPTVVFGFFAALTVAPLLRDLGAAVGLDVASESALAAGLVMGIMIIPFVSSLSDDVINAVPQAMRDGSLALGATRSETVKKVVVPAALPGIVGALLLAISRAIGETMIVVMAAGLAANLTVNPIEAVTTVTVQIVTLLVGDQEFDSAKTLAAFALGLVLFVATLALNVVALVVVRRYREKYD